jgi:Tol biopolymer transport system component
MRLTAGSRLGPYEVLGPIGAGGMGEVYRARDTRLGREVAIKVLPEDLVRDRERLLRFEREARSASALNHRNIVTIHDFTSQDGEAWLVMELIKGESLRSVMSRGPIPTKRVAAIGAGIADGLAAAHAAGIVHRDLKPENVMIGADGTAKILDFGLVKAAAVTDATNSPTEAQVSRSGRIVGTAAYMSPEQAAGGAVDFRSDHFSFGLILAEMATGRHPFARRSAVETLAAILHDDPEPLPSSVPEPLAWIIERCLQREPALRYGSTADLAHDLHRLAGRPASSVAVRPAAPRRRALWPLVALLVLASALTAAALWPRREIVKAEPVYADLATPELAEIYLLEAMLPLSISPDGRFLLISGIGTNRVDGVWLRDLRTGRTRLVAERARMACWSDDGSAIAFIAEGKLKTVPTSGGPARVVCDARPEATPAWYGDTILFGQYSNDRSGMYRVNAGGGTPELIIPAGRAGPDFKPAWWPQFLPGGKRFLYLQFELGKELEIEHSLQVASIDGTGRKQIGRVNSRAALANDHLLFVSDGTLMAQPFDVEKEELHGQARPILEGVYYFRSTGLAAFSVSNDGVLAWRSGRPNARLVWLDRAGFEISTVGTGLMVPEGRLSPDGTRYAVGMVDAKQGVSDVWTFDLASGNPERLTTRLLDEKAPVWLPDGSFFYRSDGGGGPPDIFRMRVGDERGSVFHRGPGVEEPADVSRDGRWLLFVDVFAAADIFLLDLATPGPARPLVVTQFRERQPRFSPDSRWIAYSSDVSGTLEVYVRSFNEPPVTTRVSREGGSRPRWSRDGKELYFIGAGGRVMAVPMDNGRPGTPRTLFQSVDLVDFEPAGDGSRFLAQVTERSGDTSLHLLLNWPAVLER